jgi:hypothetical protein
VADLFIDGLSRSAEEVGGQLGEETLESGGLVQSVPGAGQAAYRCDHKKAGRLKGDAGRAHPSPRSTQPAPRIVAN